MSLKATIFPSKGPTCRYIATGVDSGHTIAFRGEKAMRDYLSGEGREDIRMVRAVATREDKEAYGHAVDSGNEYA